MILSASFIGQVREAVGAILSLFNARNAWLVKGLSSKSETLGVLDGAADVLGTVVAANHLRFAAPGDDLLQGPD